MAFAYLLAILLPPCLSSEGRELHSGLKQAFHNNSVVGVVSSNDYSTNATVGTYLLAQPGLVTGLKGCTLRIPIVGSSTVRYVENFVDSVPW